MPTRSSRRRRVDPDDRRAVAALAKQLAVRSSGGAPRQGSRRPGRRGAAAPLDARFGVALIFAAVRKAAQFKRDGEVLLNRISREVQLINASWTPWKSAFDNPPPPRGDLLHVFVPDERGTQGPFVYRLQWRFDQDPAQGVKSGADVRTGKMWVEPYTIDKQLSCTLPWAFECQPDRIRLSQDPPFRDSCVAWLEDHEFTVRQPLAAAERALGNRDPANSVPSRWLIAPAFTWLERDQYVVDPAWSRHWTRRGLVRTDDEACRTNLRHELGAEVLTFWFGALQFRRKGDPQLKALHHGDDPADSSLPCHIPSPARAHSRPP